jgi:hypothetical protein
MRSEKEIRDKITELQKLVRHETKEVNRCVKNDNWDFADIHMDLGNTYKNEIYYLMWVLGEV